MFYEVFSILAQATPAPAPQPGIGSSMMIPFLCIGIIFYFLMIRPQQTKVKKHQAMVSSLKTGDKVVTTGGIHGLISNVKESTLIIKIAENVKIEVDKLSVVKRSETDTAPAKTT